MTTPVLLIPNAPPLLAAAGTYSSAWINITNYTGVGITVRSDVAGTLYIDWSANGSDTDDTFTYDIAPNLEDFHRITRRNAFIKVRYVNNGTPQTYFTLQLSAGDFQPVSVPLNRQLQRDADATLVRGIPSFLEISTDKFLGISKVNIVGINSDIDSGSVPEWIWDGPTGAYTGFPTGNAEAIRITSDSANDASAGSGARTVLVTGLDENWEIASETITLSGLTPAVSTTTFRRVHFAYVTTSGSSNEAFNAGTLTIAHNVTTANVFMTILPGRNNGQVAVYTVPANKRGILTKIKVEVDRAAGSNIFGFMWVREFGQCPRYLRPVIASSTGAYYEEPYGGIIFPEKTDIGVVITTCSANNTLVESSFDIVIVDDD